MINKTEEINLMNIRNALPGAYFYGEVWICCPHCLTAHEVAGKTPLYVKDGYDIYQCKKCGELFKDK